MSAGLPVSSSNSELAAGSETPEVGVIIPAGGQGVRLGPGRKQFRELEGRSVLEWTLHVFQDHPRIDQIFIAAPDDQRLSLSNELQKAGFDKVVAVVSGGETRQDSVANALDAVPASIDFLLVHDAVRPFVSTREIDDVILAVQQTGAAAVAIPVADTLRKAEHGRFGQTVSRERLLRMQTPQAFRTSLLQDAYDAAKGSNRIATDDVALVQAIGHAVSIVDGSESNFKITTPGDWDLAERIVQSRISGEHP